MFELEHCVGLMTNNIAKLIADSFNERLKSSGVTWVQWTALFYIGKFVSINQKVLSDKMMVRGSTIVRLIDRMERDNLIMRVRDLEDRRNINLVLTENGGKIRAKLLPVGEQMSQILLKDISDKEIQCFKRVLNKLQENLS